MVTITQHRWQDIVEESFDLDEQHEILVATTGLTIAPQGFTVDESQLSPELRAKVLLHFPPAALRPGRGGSL